MNEFKQISADHPTDAAFVIARVSRVVQSGLEEAEGDSVVGAEEFYWFQRGRVGVVYQAENASGGADVLVLTFSNLKAERFPAALIRAKARIPEGAR